MTFILRIADVKNQIQIWDGTIKVLIMLGQLWIKCLPIFGSAYYSGYAIIKALYCLNVFLVLHFYQNVFREQRSVCFQILL